MRKDPLRKFTLAEKLEIDSALLKTARRKKMSWDCLCSCGCKFWMSKNTGIDGVTICPGCRKPFAG